MDVLQNTAALVFEDINSEKVPLLEKRPEVLTTRSSRRNEVKLETPDEGSKMYNVKAKFVTPPLVTGKLPEAFQSLFVFKKPDTPMELGDWKKKMLRDFVGDDVTDDQFEHLKEFCSTENARAGKELTMNTPYPHTSVAAIIEAREYFTSAPGASGESEHLETVRKYKKRVKNDKNDLFAKMLKYRGIRFLPQGQAEDDCIIPVTDREKYLVPGQDILYRIRVYRPFPYSPKERVRSGNRHPLIDCDIALLGRQTLQELRDHIQCPNDGVLRADRSAQPDLDISTTSRELFPSAFLFINNEFYVDRRDGCSDLSAPVRAWALKRGLGTYPVHDLDCSLDQLTLRLGYPEVFVHQGNCEHLFTFSEVRLIGLNDPLQRSLVANQRFASQHHAIQCTACAEFVAKWIVTNCPEVPFDPAFFCDTCFKLYLYIDGRKVSDFKAFAYTPSE